ncbi:hypothetical protein RHMOL_Rhmol02G0220200 [Rhododendron molle]|uniref:Uncharacterized protein n=1 Tax=Rhododendron molle TaxID=49168 RepID=A0ACC0PU71_RHOML|nr:hypothetical protein RHMOL_Rhmol02G0220200 [Rhododendron molle]
MGSSRGSIIVREGLLGPECPHGFSYSMPFPATALKIDLQVREAFVTPIGFRRYGGKRSDRFCDRDYIRLVLRDRVGPSLANVVSGHRLTSSLGRSKPNIIAQEEDIDWLQRSVVAKLPNLRNLDSLREAFYAEGVLDIQIRDMGEWLTTKYVVVNNFKKAVCECNGGCFARALDPSTIPQLDKECFDEFDAQVDQKEDDNMFLSISDESPSTTSPFSHVRISDPEDSRPPVKEKKDEAILKLERRLNRAERKIRKKKLVSEFGMKLATAKKNARKMSSTSISSQDIQNRNSLFKNARRAMDIRPGNFRR